jgi:hypothetical protein
MLRLYIPKSLKAYARVLCSGKTLAFQANDRGSIPLTRFFNKIVVVLLILGVHPI